MFLIKLLRKLGKLIRSGAGARQIYLGAIIGAMIGMTPGMNLTLLALILLLLLLNAHVGIALLAFVVGKICCLLLAPLTFQIGFLIIHRVGLEGVLRSLADAPVAALMDLPVYCLTGGLPVGLLIGVALGWAALRATTALRVGIVEAAARSPRMQRLAKLRVVRFFLWIVFGKQRGDLSEMKALERPLLRKGGLILTGIVALVALGLELLLMDYAVGAGIEKGLAVANGAEVNLASAQLSLAEGKLALEGLQITDPERPTHNSLQVARATADLSVVDLLKGRIVIAELVVSDARTGVQRPSPGAVYEKQDREREETGPEAEEEGRSLEDYVESARKWKGYLDKLEQFLEERKAAKEREEEKERLTGLAPNRGYLSLSAKDLLAHAPTVLVRKLGVERMRFSEAGRAYDLIGEEVSSQPQLNDRPMTVVLRPSAGGEEAVKVQFNLHQPGAMHTAALNLRDVSLGSAIRVGKGVPAAVQGGRASLRLAGEFSAETIEMPFQIEVADLVAGVAGGEGILGLDAATSQEVLSALRQLRIEGQLTGSLRSPRVQVDTEGVLDELKDSLAEAGKEALLAAVDERIGELEKELKGKLEEAIGGSLPEGLDVRIPRFGDEDDDEDDVPKTEEEKQAARERKLEKQKQREEKQRRKQEEKARREAEESGELDTHDGADAETAPPQ